MFLLAKSHKFNVFGTAILPLQCALLSDGVIKAVAVVVGSVLAGHFLILVAAANIVIPKLLFAGGNGVYDK
eukprot:7879410-Ditylum_brightwellii.AAC.1